MVTASHNPEPDNGVKVVDPYGEMLEQSWEAWATDLANCRNDGLAAMLAKISEEAGIDQSIAARVVMARDTRPSGCVIPSVGCLLLASVCKVISQSAR